MTGQTEKPEAEFGGKPAGHITVSGSPMPYWTKDGRPMEFPAKITERDLTCFSPRSPGLQAGEEEEFLAGSGVYGPHAARKLLDVTRNTRYM